MAKSSAKTTIKKAARKTKYASAAKSPRRAPAKKPKPKSSTSGKDELKKLFEHALKDIYWVEKSLTKAIPKMIRKASAPELVEALKIHLEVTENQVDMVERVFKGIGIAARAKKCAGMEGILKEGEELMTESAGPALDSAIIAAGQKVEHYEISSYTSMINLAKTLYYVKEADILQDILDEEMEADKLLTDISIRVAHQTAINTSD
ncbi:MAG: ferritin-like domain-containing protein [Bacteroidota bacterium]|nr:ferritin-like domain-containing protein [Bacteroidota bacterium]